MGWVSGGNANLLMQVMRAVAELRSGPRPVTPHHWEIEFPEVFTRENPGFDAIVGNPPFHGGTLMSSAFGESYRDWLYSVYEDSGNRMDLVAYFFRRAFALLRPKGAMGLIATNTIGQGDTRRGSLGWICRHGGQIYRAVCRLKWPGLAAVVVNVIHCCQGQHSGDCELNGRVAPRITPFLTDKGSNEDPVPLGANADKSFEGFKPAGQGFIFDDHDEAASSISLAKELLTDSANWGLIRNYIGGEEVNDSPTHSPVRYAIDFADRKLEEAEAWPRLLDIVRESKADPGQSESGHAPY